MQSQTAQTTVENTGPIRSYIKDYLVGRNWSKNKLDFNLI